MKVRVLSLMLIFLSAGLVGRAQSSGYGCKVNNIVYTQYLGTATAYKGQAKKRYFKNTTKILIHNNSQNPGYWCGYINVYPASNYWENGHMQCIEAQDEITSETSNTCVIASSLGATPTGNGNDVTFKFNNPEYCNSNPGNLPLDSGTWVLLIAGTIGGAILIRKMSIAGQA